MLLDEATQAKESTLLCALALGAQQLVMVGDPKQLGAMDNTRELHGLSEEERADLGKRLQDSPFRRRYC